MKLTKIAKVIIKKAILTTRHIKKLLSVKKVKKNLTMKKHTKISMAKI